MKEVKFSVDRKTFLDTLSMFRPLYGKNSSKPILNGVKLRIENGKLSVECTDLECAGRALLRTDRDGEDGPWIVPGKALFTSLNANRKGNSPVFFTFREKDFKADGATWMLDDPEEFPLIPTVELKNTYHINDSAKLQNNIFRALPALAKDINCYAYNGMMLEFFDRFGSYCCVGTDGRRLAVCGSEHSIWLDKPKESFVLPAHGMGIVARYLGKYSHDFPAYFTPVKEKKQILFTHEPGNKTPDLLFFSIHMRLLEGDFPKYRAVLPDYNYSVGFNRERLIELLKRTSLTAGKEVRSVNFSLPLSSDEVTLHSESEGIGETTVKMPFSHRSILKDLDITFNPDFLLDWLKTETEGHVTFWFDTKEPGKSAAKLTSFNAEQIYMVMPINDTSSPHPAVRSKTKKEEPEPTPEPEEEVQVSENVLDLPSLNRWLEDFRKDLAEAL